VEEVESVPEFVGLGEGDGLWREVVAFAGLLFEKKVVAALVFLVFVAGLVALALDEPAVDADTADPDALLGGLNGSVRRFWGAWRSTGMVLRSICFFLVL
jgi:hypothetical protein